MIQAEPTLFLPSSAVFEKTFIVLQLAVTYIFTREWWWYDASPSGQMQLAVSLGMLASFSATTAMQSDSNHRKRFKPTDSSVSSTVLLSLLKQTRSKYQYSQAPPNAYAYRLRSSTFPDSVPACGRDPILMSFFSITTFGGVRFGGDSTVSIVLGTASLTTARMDDISIHL